jgi:hypothetical protein
MTLSIIGTENAKAYREKIRALQAIEDEIDKEIEARLKELDRIQRSKIKLRAKATYKPTAEAIAYREEHWAAIERQPRPVHGGPAGLRLAALEAAQWDLTHRRGTHTTLPRTERRTA